MGDLEALMYLHTEGCPWDNQIPAAAVNNGNMECLRYALEHNCPVHEGLLSVAAFAANVEVLECLYTHGLRWNEITMMAALTARKVENVRFLVEAGCDISFIACTDWLCSILSILTWLSTVSVYFLHVFQTAFGGYYANYISPDLARRTITRFCYVVVMFWVVYLAQKGLKHLA